MENTENSTYLLDKWTGELARGLIPNNVILSLYIVTGLLGNATVILIYTFKMRGSKEDRYFIPFLAMTDLLASLICASLAIAQNMMQAKFNNTHLCKAWCFFAVFSTSTSVFILLGIAVHRYLKVCRPHGKQMTMVWKRFALGSALTLPFIYAVPVVHFYGSETFPNDENGIVGLRCTRLKTTNKIGSVVFGGAIVITAVATIFALIFIYSRIGYTIHMHFKLSKSECKPDTSLEAEKSCKTNNSHVTISSNNEPLNDSDSGTCPTKTNIETTNTEFSKSLSLHRSTNATGKISNTNTKCEGNVNSYESSVKQRKERKNQRVVHKFTLMFMLITIIFLVCYIPKVILLLLEASNPNFWEEFSDSARAGVLFIYRMYIINNIANPIIYAFLDKQFAKEIKLLLKVCK
jgi:hypothetical protein